MCVGEALRDVFGAAAFTRSRRRSGTFGFLVLLNVIVLVLTGCAGASNSSTHGSGTLTLNMGTIFAQTGAAATIGPPAIAAANLAVADVNAANLGIHINLIQKDSGDTSTNIATQSVTSLLASSVTAIVGTEQSSVTKTVVDQIAKAGVVQISPANTSPEFSTYDSNHFYWRTTPSDVLQGRVLAQKILKDGPTSVAILCQNDSYGQGLKDSVAKEISAGGGNVTAEICFDPKAANYAAEVDKALASKPDALVVISFDQIKQIVPELAKAGFDFKTLYGVDANFAVIDETFTNVDIAGAQFTNSGVQATADFAARVAAQAPKNGMPPLKVLSFAAETYDAVILVALAALQGKAVDGTTLKNNLQSVSDGGTKVTTFEEGARLIAAGQDVDYDGLSGPITFASNGDPQQAYISVYKYGPGNTTAYESAEFGDLRR
jgi:branched-chain amino acid transport system substrate-binding protein